ncbi:hypothetical protein Tco_0407840 [Tanacetum coccineum]
MVKEISLPQDVRGKSNCCLIELEIQVQRLMEAHLAPKQPIQVTKITSSWDDSDMMLIEIIKNNDDSCKDEPEAGEDAEAGELEVMRRKLDPRGDPNRGVSNFMGRIKGMHVFVGNFTYVIDFMIVEDISLIIYPRLSRVVLGKPFIEMSNMSHDPSEGVVRFTNGTNEVAYKMPHKIEQCDSLSDLEKNIQNLSTLGTRRIREEE